MAILLYIVKTYRPCDMMMSTASSTRCRSDSSEVRRIRSWAGGRSNNIPVILAARDCGDNNNNNNHLFQIIVHVQCVHRVLKQMQDVAV